MRKGSLIVVAVVLIALLVACGPDSSPVQPDTRLTIAVIPKGTTHVFWKSVEAGARKAGEELDINIVWKGPLKENDRAQQIALVEQFVGEGVDGIVLAPLDDRALLRPVKAAAMSQITVVIIDSGLRAGVGQYFASFVATDNREGGRLAGRRLPA